MVLFNKNLFIIIFSFVCSTVAESNQCYVNVPSDDLSRPVIKTSFGTKQILLPHYINKIKMRDGDTLEAYCNKAFKVPNTVFKKITLLCSNTIIHCSDCSDGRHYNDNYNQYGEGHLTCENSLTEWELFEILPIFPFCSNNGTPYAVGKREFNSTNFVIGICYNIEQMKLESVFHTMGTTQEFTYKLFENYTISVELEDGWKYLIRERFVSKDDALKNWINVFGQYENDLLIENHSTQGYLEHFGSLLHIPWWRNLRLGNWHKYQKILNERSRIYGYKMITGITGRLEVPVENECNHNITMKLSKDHIPMYVWNYIESDIEAQEKYIIFGINSPFYEFHDENDLIFCKDICHEIDWLKEVAKTFRFSIMGIVFCCTVDEAIKSNRLNGFLKELQPINLDITDATPPIEYITESNYKYYYK